MRVRSAVSPDRLLGMLGLAMRAGKVVIGLEEIAKSATKRRLRLVITSEGASDGTKKKIRTKCDFYGIENITVDVLPSELGKRLGKTSAPVCVGIVDEGFARTIADICRCEE